MKSLSSINEIAEFQKPNVHVGDKEELLKKINKIIADGHSQLQIVTDFDHTMTRHTLDNGTAVLTSFGSAKGSGSRAPNGLCDLLLYGRTAPMLPQIAKKTLSATCRSILRSTRRVKRLGICGICQGACMLRECPSVPQHYKDEDNRLAAIYKPIEADPAMSIEEKTQHMVNWYIAARALLQDIKFPRAEMMEIAKKMVASFRAGVSELISWAWSQQVPVLVFSAGLGESVLAALSAAGYMLPNVKVVSNFLEFDNQDKITGIKGEIIHTYNKNETAIKGTEYYEMVKNRSNVILMGDNIGDAGMAEGMEHCNVVIKVGFLGHKAEGNLENYLEKFDIVLVNEPTMDVVNAILKLVL